jgi:N-acetylmuramoyl-L-alanine amidase
MKIVISSGHGKFVRGASGYLDEVDEARRVVNELADRLARAGVNVEVFHDDVSLSQSENLNRIVGFHNSEQRDLDVSVHFNAYETTGAPMGVEVLYVTQYELAGRISEAISTASGLKNRGPKKRDDLAFLNNTKEPAIIIETCFVDSTADAGLYEDHFQNICAAITAALSGQEEIPPEPEPEPPESGNLLDIVQPLVFIHPVQIYTAFSDSYVAFISNLDICNDGSGPDHGDPHHNPETAYYNGGKFLNADVDKFLVIPPQVRELLKPKKVMGAQGRVTNLKTGVWSPAVTGEIGPEDKSGEAAYCLAKTVNPTISYNSGDLSRIYLYELWPGLPAAVDGKIYSLE